MLTELRVENLGIIAELQVALTGGLTAITGETGAGKTLLIDALELLCGGRAEPQIVRDGEDVARVEGRFVVEDEELVLARVVPVDGRSRGYINGRLATASELAALGRDLVDLHGQHAHQSLLAPVEQRALLDRFAGEAARNALTKLRAARARMREIVDELARLGGDERSRAREVDLLRYQLGEIDAAALARRRRGRSPRRGGGAARWCRGPSRRAGRRVRRARGIGGGCRRCRGRRARAPFAVRRVDRSPAGTPGGDRGGRARRAYDGRGDRRRSRAPRRRAVAPRAAPRDHPKVRAEHRRGRKLRRRGACASRRARATRRAGGGVRGRAANGRSAGGASRDRADKGAPGCRHSARRRRDRASPHARHAGRRIHGRARRGRLHRRRRRRCRVLPRAQSRGVAPASGASRVRRRAFTRDAGAPCGPLGSSTDACLRRGGRGDRRGGGQRGGAGPGPARRSPSSALCHAPRPGGGLRGHPPQRDQGSVARSYRRPRRPVAR